MLCLTWEQVQKLQLGEPAGRWCRFLWGSDDSAAGILCQSSAGVPAAMLCKLDPALGQDSLTCVRLPRGLWLWDQFAGPRWSPDLSMLLLTGERLHACLSVSYAFQMI